ncbi:DUF3986 family protein [Jeotgalibacillus sp. S-D1]|uniref:DUF3986 family protein n=1 Tax=Jeotgalibacillus sp. S-D1 TaxID=2552189 RepID=UPI001F0FC4D1|nr:DUF3986 family protein [Jeotgalibacillus sp. S-D1]
MLYDDRYYLHLGYYENGYDLEAIAFKRKSQGVWDIFFDFERYGLENPNEKNELNEFGIKIFSIEIQELDVDYGEVRYKQWLSDQEII